MKTLLMIAALMISHTVFATDFPTGFVPVTTPLAKGSISLTPIAGEEISRTPMCPKGDVCILDGTNVNLQFRLGGCMDTLSAVSYMVDYKSQTLYVSANHIGNEESASTMCLIEPIVVVNVPAYGLFGNFEVRYVGTESTVVY